MAFLRSKISLVSRVATVLPPSTEALRSGKNLIDLLSVIYITYHIKYIH